MEIKETVIGGYLASLTPRLFSAATSPVCKSDKYHMGRILEQLQLKSREEAIVYAHQRGLVEPEE